MRREHAAIGMKRLGPPSTAEELCRQKKRMLPSKSGGSVGGSLGVVLQLMKRQSVVSSHTIAEGTDVWGNHSNKKNRAQISSDP